MKQGFLSALFLFFSFQVLGGLPNSLVLDRPVINPDSIVYFEKNVNLDLVSRQDLVREFLRNRQNFVPLDELKMNPGKNESAYWMLLTVRNSSENEKLYVVELGKGYFWKANLFVLTEAGALLFEDSYSVLSDSFDRDRLLPRVSFPFSVPPGESRHLLLRLKAYDIAKVPLRLVEMQHHINDTFTAHIIVGLLFGIIGSLFIYNAALFISMGGRWLFYLLCTIASAGIYIMTSANIVPLFSHAPSVFGVLTLIGMLLFTRAFLQTAAGLRFINILLIVHIAVLPVGIIVIPFGGIGILDSFHSITIITSMAVMVAAGLVGPFMKERRSWIFMAAIFLFCAGVVTSVLNQFGIRYGGATFFFSRAEQPGFAVSLLLLSAAVSGRVKNLREEKIKAEQLSLRMMEEHRKKVDFFAGISHELRTPLANLQLPLERIIRGEEGCSIASGNSIFRQMHRQTKRLNRHINNLLTITKIEDLSSDLVTIRTDLDQLCRDCAADFRSIAAQKGLELRYENMSPGCCTALVERNLLESAILNLLDNAVKYTGEGEITLVLQSDGTTIQIEVGDTGRGMSRDEVERVPARYYTTGENNGFGIGLSVVHNVTRLHGGTLDINSTPGIGTKVTLNLPVLVDGGTRHNQLQEQPRVISDDKSESIIAEKTQLPNTAPRILVVEDDPDLRSSLYRLLSPHFHVSLARDGKEGLLRLTEELPQLIVSDIMMPEMNGLEFIRQLRVLDETAAVPVIFLTALSSDEDILKGLQYGAVDYVRKPFNRDVLLEKIRSFISSEERLIKDYDRRFQKYLNNWNPLAGQGREKTGEGTKEGMNLQQAATSYRLTDKQAEIFELVIKGYTNKEIAEFLEVSKKTVDNHVSTILKKTGVSRRTQLSFEMLQKE